MRNSHPDATKPLARGTETAFQRHPQRHPPYGFGLDASQIPKAAAPSSALMRTAPAVPAHLQSASPIAMAAMTPKSVAGAGQRLDLILDSVGTSFELSEPIVFRDEDWSAVRLLGLSG
jgi:hypothetical protein